MKAKAKILSGLALLSALVATLFFATGAFAQESGPSRAAAAGIVGVIMMIYGVFFVAGYIYGAMALQTIAKKTNTPNAVWAWIPILQAILALNIAKKPVWWIVLFLIPLVNIVIAVLVCMGIAEARHKPSWWGILAIVPPINIIVPGYLAWSE